MAKYRVTVVKTINFEKDIEAFDLREATEQVKKLGFKGVCRHCSRRYVADKSDPIIELAD